MRQVTGGNLITVDGNRVTKQLLILPRHRDWQFFATSIPKYTHLSFDAAAKGAQVKKRYSRFKMEKSRGGKG